MSSMNKTENNAPVILDTRPIFAAGGSPCSQIDDAAAAVVPGQSLIIIVPFEPVPLFAKLGKAGFSHQAHQLSDGAWQAEFRRERVIDNPAAAIVSCSCGH